MSTSSPDRPHALYRFFGHAGELLYVGLTNDPGRRWSQHRRDKPWWFDVARIHVEAHPDRQAVEAAETRAIRVERPRYNVAKVGGAHPVVPVEASPTYRVPCDACPAGATVLAVLTAEVQRYRARREWLNDPAVPMDGKVWRLTDPLPPAPARWQVTCDEHYAGDDVAFYWYRVPASLAHAVGVLRHLGEKEWVREDTAALGLAERLLAPKESRLSRARTG